MFNNSVANDTRQCTTGRLWSGDGYSVPPSVDDCFLFQLPYVNRYVGRDVELDGHRWELWSPNSSICPYYPGLRHAGFGLSLPSTMRSRRFDGHLGRFDPTRCPQYYDADHPWLGFIRRPESVTTSEIEEYAEWWEICDHWESDPSPARTTGCVTIQFMLKLTARGMALQDLMKKHEDIRGKEADWWANRPKYPTHEDIQSLSKVREWDEALDLCKALQRGMKEQLAWIDLAGAELKARPYPLNALRRRAISPAIDRWMGVWLNGVGETRGLWLLTVARVPCFVIHEYLPGVDYPTISGETSIEEHRGLRWEPSFLMGTPMADAFSPERNPYENIRRMKGSLTANLPTSDVLGFGIASSRYLLPSDRIRSSSWAQGYSRPALKIRDVSVASSVSVASPDARAIVSNTPEAGPSVVRSTTGVSKPRTTDRAVSSFPHPRVEEVLVDRGMPVWERPPPIMGVTGTKKWSNWWQVKEEDGSPCFLRHKEARATGSRRFDRQARRVLYFDVSPELRTSEFGGVRFGRRVPDWNFYVLDALGRRFAKKNSWWMYRTQDAVASEIGEKAIIPTSAEMLNGMAMAGIKRGDGYVTEDDDDDEEDWSPTYLDNKSYDPSAMDVDVPSAPPPVPVQRRTSPENRDKIFHHGSSTPHVPTTRDVFIRRSRSRSLDDGMPSRRGDGSRSRSRSRNRSVGAASGLRRRHSESSDSHRSARRSYGKIRRVSRSPARGWNDLAQRDAPSPPPPVLITEFLCLGGLSDSISFDALRDYVVWIIEEAGVPMTVTRVFHLAHEGKVWWYLKLDDRRSALILRGFLVDRKLGPNFCLSCEMLTGDEFELAESEADVVYRHGFGPAVPPAVFSGRGMGPGPSHRGRSRSSERHGTRRKLGRSPGRRRSSSRRRSSGHRPSSSRQRDPSDRHSRSSRRRSASPSRRATDAAPRRLEDRLHSPASGVAVAVPTMITSSPLLARMELSARVAGAEPAPAVRPDSNRYMAPTSPEPRLPGRRGRRSGWKNQPGH